MVLEAGGLHAFVACIRCHCCVVGIVDKAVDRMIDLVISQQEHIMHMQHELDQYRLMFKQQEH